MEVGVIVVEVELVELVVVVFEVVVEVVVREFLECGWRRVTRWRHSVRVRVSPLTRTVLSSPLLSSPTVLLQPPALLLGLKRYT